MLLLLHESASRKDERYGMHLLLVCSCFWSASNIKPSKLLSFGPPCGSNSVANILKSSNDLPLA